MAASTNSQSCVAGMRIMIVEDNYLLAHELQTILTGLECHVVGPAATVSEGLDLAATYEIDGAILDVHVVGGTSYPIALQLLNSNTPFFFITGFASPDIDGTGLENIPRLHKPVDVETLVRTMEQLFSRR